jgi:hypothetical protein
VAAFAAGVMIAQQVAGKATRDALFLSHFGAAELPKVMISSAVLSIAGVLVTSAAMQRFAPARVVPTAFATSGALFAAEWFLVGTSPGIAAWVIYLHMAVFGALVISGFWSLVNERFDPHSAKKAVARIGAVAAFGGLVGGVSAERVAVLLDPRSMLLLLAGANVVCAFAVARVAAPLRRRRRTEDDRAVGPGDGLRILREVPYLQKLAALVALVAMTAALLDFALKAQAAERLESGQTLMQFFAIFYTATGLLTFVVQSLFARRVLERLGLDGTIALLPSLVLLSGVLATAVTRMWTVVLVRGVETVLANSFFRSGYELLYTPLAARQKRATKTIIDVAFDRMGDATGSAVIFLVLWLTPAETTVAAVIGVAACVAAVAFVVARTLQPGYVGALAESLRSGAVQLGAEDVVDATTRRTLSETTLALDRERLLAEVAALRRQSGRISDDDVRLALGEGEPSDGAQTAVTAEPELAHQVERLLSGDVARVRKALEHRPFDPRLTALAVLHLGNDALYRSARDALGEVTKHAPGGVLVDALLDPDEPPIVRRRIPRLLARSDSPIVMRGLLDGLSDEHFEVRYQCGQAVARICAKHPHLTPPAEEVLLAAREELEVEREVLESRRGEDEDAEAEAEPGDEQHAWLDDVIRNRMLRGVEHVFTLLSLTMDREPLLLSLRALHSDDEGLRGTALEYLENVVPEDIHERLLPYLDAREPKPADRRRSRQQIVDELLRSMDNLRLSDSPRGS